MSSPGQPYRVAIIGIGAIAEIIAAALAHIPRAQLVAGSCRTADKGRKFAEKFHCQWFDDTERMLDEARPDVAVICTPSGAHLEPALACAARRIHIVCEKPLEITTARARRMVEAARDAGVCLGAIFPQRFNPINIALHEAASQGRFGEIAIIQGTVPWWREDSYYAPSRWQGKQALDGGGALINQAIHSLDLMQWIGGQRSEVRGQRSEKSAQASELTNQNSVTEVFAYTGQRGHDPALIEVEDSAVIVMKFRNGAMGQLLAATSMWPGIRRRLLVGGRDGSVEIFEDQLISWQFRSPRPEDESIRQRFAEPTRHGGGAGDPMALTGINHRLNLGDYFDALAEGREPKLNGAEAIKAVAIIEACYESARSGRAMKVEG